MSYIERIRRQLFAKNFARIAIPMVIVMAIAVSMFTYMYESYSRRYIQMTVDNSLMINTGTFERINGDLNRQARYLLADSNVSGFFLNDNILNTQQEYRYCVKFFNAVTENQMNSCEYIKSISIYSDITDYVMGTDESGYITYMKKPIWLEFYQSREYVSQYITHYDGENIRLFYLYPARIYGEVMGAVITELYYDRYMELFDINLLDDFYILNEDGCVIVSNHPEDINTVKAFEKTEKLYATDTMNTGLYSVHMTYSREKILNFTVLSVSFYVIAVLILIIMSAMLLFTAFRTHLPIHKILDLLDEQIVDYDGHKNLKYEKEYEFVIENVRNTINDNKRLHEQLAEKLKALNKMHTVALQAQIDPHYLSNTLQAISLCAECELHDGNIVSKMIVLLSELISINYSTKSHLTTLSEEIRHIILFYKLQRIMLGEKLFMDINISPKFYDCMIPKITLQPVIENALCYGIKPAKKNCRVVVSAEQSDDMLVISISNDGVGMTKEELDKLNLRLSANEFAEDISIGLSNINQRIKLIFGSEYGIRVQSEYEKGTDVKIYLPVKR